MLREAHIIGFALVIALLLISGIMGYAKASHLASTNRAVVRTSEVINCVETVLSTVKDAETGQRGYLLTQDESYLQPFHVSLKQTDENLRLLRSLASDDIRQRARVDQIESTIRDKLQELNLTVQQAQRGDRDGALEIVRAGTGKVLMDNLRSQVDAIQETEQQLLTVQTAEAQRSYESTIWAIVVSTVLGIGLTGFVVHLTQKNLRQRQASLEEVSEQKELLHTTLASIGDGVITTDTEGRVVNLNPVAVQLTGWTNEEARGKLLTKVFQIINETTRRTVENPAMRALAEGIIVGLANHTILISKDGQERFIDDSAAPIRQEGGSIVGCVLVFRDISERRELEKQAQERLFQARLLASIVETSSDAIISQGLDGTIQSWNNGAQALFGYQASDAIGQHISMIIPDERMSDEEEFVRRLRSGEPVRHFETVRRKSDGQIVDVSINLSPIVDESGQIIAASKISRDITERKQVEDRLRQLAAELSDSSARKDEFLATLAHELRNPLAPIRNGIQILSLSGKCEGIVEETRVLIERQVNQLVRLVDDLLDVSRISRGKLEMRRRPMNLADAIKLAVETSRPIIDESGHELEVQMPSEPVVVNADQVRLAQVFSNLLNNAAKYSERGSKISLVAEKLGDEVTITVKDNGIGISKEMLVKVFEIFTQVDTSLEKSQGGLGIGLTLVKRFVDMHDGTVEARSAGRGHGSEFVVSLPLTPAEVAEAAPAETREHTEAKYKILVADDNKDSARTLALILSLWGHEVRTANDGMEALQIAEAFRPEIIVLDIGMPKLNGYEACRRIRATPWGQEVTIIALTGWGQNEDKRLSQEAGFSYHMIKPLDPAELKQRLLTP